MPPFVFIVLGLASVDAEPPRGLTCLPRWYAGTVDRQADAGWGLRLVDGGFIAWSSPPRRDAGVTDAGVADDEEAATEDLSAIYEVSYPRGPIVAIEAADAGAIQDPGRARVVQLFAATYGENKTDVFAHLGRVRFFGMRYRFHERAVPALEAVIARLTALLEQQPTVLPFLKRIGGTWHWRRIARSPQLSAHAFGIAIDLNVDRSHYWRWQRPKTPLKWKNRVPQAIVDAFEAEGFIWGGRWQHYDTMHFEYRPELLSPDCR